MSIPNFYFIPDKNYDGVPDGEPIVLARMALAPTPMRTTSPTALRGARTAGLYGTHGVTNWSMLGKPGTSEGEAASVLRAVCGATTRCGTCGSRIAIGTTNPWGIDWNDYGHAFVCNCVNPHLFHVIQGAFYDPATQSSHR